MPYFPRNWVYSAHWKFMKSKKAHFPSFYIKSYLKTLKKTNWDENSEKKPQGGVSTLMQLRLSVFRAFLMNFRIFNSFLQIKGLPTIAGSHPETRRLLWLQENLILKSGIFFVNGWRQLKNAFLMKFQEFSCFGAKFRCSQQHSQ